MFTFLFLSHLNWQSNTQAELLMGLITLEIDGNYSKDHYQCLGRESLAPYFYMDVKDNVRLI